jgi:hypothetical protein
LWALVESLWAGPVRQSAGSAERARAAPDVVPGLVRASRGSDAPRPSAERGEALGGPRLVLESEVRPPAAGAKAREARQPVGAVGVRSDGPSMRSV